MPTWHYLRSNKSQALPCNVYYVDTEARVLSERDGIQWQGFRLGVTCYARRRSTGEPWIHHWADWTDGEALVRDMAARAATCKTLYVVASNPVYDLWILDAYRRLFDLGYRLRFFYDHGLVHICKAVSGKTTICVVALQNYYPLGIKTLGSYLGFQKLDVDPLTAPESEVWKYCRRDTDILRLGFESWLDFVGSQDMGGFALTRSAQAMKAFRHRFMSDRILVHGNAQVREWERAAYFGGRTECFRLGSFRDGPYWFLDVNSMYPFVMHDTRVPVRLVNVIASPDLDYLRRVTGPYCVVAHVRVKTPKAAFAVRTEDGLTFPVGDFWCWVCTSGLRYAFDNGAVLDCDRLAVYQGANIFRAFVDHFYRVRQGFQAEGNTVWGQICKYLLNGLYGKFGETAPVVLADQQVEDSQLSRELIHSLDTGKVIVLTRLLGREWIESGTEDGKHSCTAIAAHITEAARIYLWTLIDRLARGRVLYCDTDSILIHDRDRRFYDDVMDPVRLGALSPEKKSARVTIHGLKDYVFKGQRTIKGVRKEAVQVGPGVYRQKMFPGIYGLLQKAPPGQFPVVTTTKALKRIYKKGRPGSFAGIVRPFTL